MMSTKTVGEFQYGGTVQYKGESYVVVGIDVRGVVVERLQLVKLIDYRTDPRTPQNVIVKPDEVTIP